MVQPDKLSDLLKPAPVVAPDPFTLESLIAWLRTKDADEAYDWHDCQGRCLIGQYSSEHGGPRYYHDQCDLFAQVADGKPSSGLLDGGCRAELIAQGEPHTFGAALSRALAYQAGAK